MFDIEINHYLLNLFLWRELLMIALSSKTDTRRNSSKYMFDIRSALSIATSFLFLKIQENALKYQSVTNK